MVKQYEIKISEWHDEFETENERSCRGKNEQTSVVGTDESKEREGKRQISKSDTKMEKFRGEAKA